MARSIVPVLRVAVTAVAAVVFAVTPARAASPRDSPVNWVHLSSDGDYFMNYDGDKNLNFDKRDWPVGMIFYSDASLLRVKGFFDTHGYQRAGGTKWLPYRRRNQTKVRLDGDRGNKDGCTDSLDRHIRLYGGVTALYDRDYGMFVVGTDHFDYGDAKNGDDPCHAANPYFGFSEQVEHDFADVLRPHYTVTEDAKNLHNYEKLHRDPNDSGGVHWWDNDGLATLVLMP